MKIIAKTLDDTKYFAQGLIKTLPKNNNRVATILDLKGDLGAGKTTLVQMFGRELGVKETIQSPTFVLMKLYQTGNALFKTLVHIDAYRIEYVDEAKILGLEKLFEDPTNLICIEWSEKIKEVIPKDVVRIECELLENDKHQYEVF